MVDSGGAVGYDIGRKTIIPYLKRNGIKDIDLALITHYHEDHSAAYISLIEEGYIKSICLPEGIYKTDLAAEIEKAALKYGCEVLKIRANQKIVTDSVEITAIGDALSSRSDVSTLMYLLSYGERRILFSGDIEKDAELRVSKTHDIDCDILKVPHHGSDTSSSDAFIVATSPEYAVITTGKNNYGHPSGEVIERYKLYGIPVLRTDVNGTIEFYLSKSRIYKTNLQRRSNYEL